MNWTLAQPAGGSAMRRFFSWIIWIGLIAIAVIGAMSAVGPALVTTFAG